MTWLMVLGLLVGALAVRPGLGFWAGSRAGSAGLGSVVTIVLWLGSPSVGVVEVVVGPWVPIETRV